MTANPRSHALRTLALTTVAVAALAGCASTSSGGAGLPAASAQSPSGGQGATSLSITAYASGDAQPESWTLTCDPPGGDHPDPAAACAALAAATTPFDPVPRDVACTEIYGGDQTATVEGTYNGSPVRASFNRTNGCEISRWDAIAPTLVLRGGV